jgi:hypothetical protein
MAHHFLDLVSTYGRNWREIEEVIEDLPPCDLTGQSRVGCKDELSQCASEPVSQPLVKAGLYINYQGRENGKRNVDGNNYHQSV